MVYKIPPGGVWRYTMAGQRPINANSVGPDQTPRSASVS